MYPPDNQPAAKRKSILNQRIIKDPLENKLETKTMKFIYIAAIE